MSDIPVLTTKEEILALFQEQDQSDLLDAIIEWTRHATLGMMNQLMDQRGYNEEQRDSSTSINDEAIYFGTLRALADLWKETLLGGDADEAAHNQVAIPVVWEEVERRLRLSWETHLAEQRVEREVEQGRLN